MYCPKCGNKQQDDNEKFCPKCGTEFPSSNDYYRTISSNKEKLQNSIEKGKKSANELALTGKKIVDDLTQKVSVQASGIYTDVKQKLADNNIETHSNVLKQHKGIFTAVCIVMILGILFFSKGGDGSEDVRSSANTEDVESGNANNKRNVTGPSIALVGKYVHPSGAYVELRSDLTATVYAGMDLKGTWESYNSTDYFEITFGTGKVLRFKEIKHNAFMNEQGELFTKR